LRIRKGLNENFNSEDEETEKKHRRAMTEEEIIIAKQKGDGYLNSR
jgi:hypothetical protein